MRPIPGWPGYQITKDGRVFSTKRQGSYALTWPLREMTISRTRGRYPKVTLCRAGHRATKAVHVLVLETYRGPRPKGMLALHRDDDPTNSDLGNLYWGSQRDNGQDRVKNGGSLRGDKHHKSRYSQEQVRLIREQAESGLTTRELMVIHGGDKSTINRILPRRTWSHI